MTSTAWWARGLLFESCNCQVICPGHTHFDQSCTHDECIGFWAIRFDEGRFGGTVPLGGLRAVIAYRSPRKMIDGGWTQSIFIDAGGSVERGAAVERILTGEVGGPWSVLGRFVGHREPTRFEPIRITDDAGRKQVVIEGVLDSTIEAIRGRDRAEPVRFENMFNQIHAPSQVIARGEARLDAGAVSTHHQGTHGLWSAFDWAVSAE